MRIPSCEVLEVSWRAQTWTCPILAQWPQVSGWSLPHSGSTPQANTSLSAGSASFPSQ